MRERLGILGCPRSEQLHDLHTGCVGSKRAGAEWAKSTLDPSWAGLVDRAWDGRPNPAFSVRQPADPQDFKRTLEFVRYIIQASTQVAAVLEIDRSNPCRNFGFDEGITANVRSE